MPQLSELVVYEVDVDTKRGVASLDRLEGEVKQTGRAATKAGKDFDKGLKREVEKAAGSAQRQMKATRSSALSLKKTLGALGLGLSAKAAFDFAKGSIQLALEQEAAENKLQLALESQGAATLANLEHLKERASALQDMSVHGDEAILGVQALALNMGVGVGKLDLATQAALDMSTALGMDLEQAMRNVAKTTGGYAGELGELIPELKGLSKEQLQAGKGIEVISRLYSGQAVGATRDFKGTLQQLSNTWGDAREEAGKALTQNESVRDSLRELQESIRDNQVAIGDWAGATVTAMAAAAKFTVDRLSEMKTAVDLLSGSEVNKVGKGDRAFHRNMLEEMEKELAEADRYQAAIAEVQGQAQRLEISGGAAAAKVAELSVKMEAARARAEKFRDRAKEVHDQTERVEQGFKDARAEAARLAAELKNGVTPTLGGVATEGQEVAKKLRDMLAAQGELAESVVELDVPMREQAELLAAIKSGGESAQQSLRKLFLEEKIDAEEFSSSLVTVQEHLDGIGQAQSKLMGDRANLVASLTQDLPGLETKRMAGGALGEDEDGVGGFQSFAEGELGDVGAQEAERAAALADLVLQYGNLNLAMQEHAIAQDEAALRAEIEKASIEGITAAQEAQIQARLKSIDVQKQEAAQAQAVAAVKKRGTVATLQSANATIGAAGSAIAAITKSSKAQMAIEAAQNTISGMTETALAYGAFARYDGWAGAQHTLAATAHFAAAAQAGKGGGGGGGSGGGGGGGGDAPRDSPGIETYRAVREGDREERGPRYEVAITGTLLGGQAEDMAREITSYLNQFNEETDGRAADVRG